MSDQAKIQLDALADVAGKIFFLKIGISLTYNF